MCVCMSMLMAARAPVRALMLASVAGASANWGSARIPARMQPAKAKSCASAVAVRARKCVAGGPLPGPDLARAHARVMGLERVALQTSNAADGLRLLQLTHSEALAGPRPSDASVSTSVRGRTCARARVRYRHLSRRAGPHGCRGRPEIGRSVLAARVPPKRHCNPVPSTRAQWSSTPLPCAGRELAVNARPRGECGGAGSVRARARAGL